MLINKNTNNNYTARQLKLPLEIEKIIDLSDPVYTFYAQTERDFALKANNMSIEINMAEQKKSMSANRAKAANIKANVVLRRQKTEPFA